MLKKTLLQRSKSILEQPLNVLYEYQAMWNAYSTSIWKISEAL